MTYPSWLNQACQLLSSKMAYDLCLSLFSALIFWIVFSWIPNHQRRKKIRPIIELDLYHIYSRLFQIFDTITRPRPNHTSYLQGKIRGGRLTREDIEFGLRNKCLNESYLFDTQIANKLMVIGESIQESSLEVDRLIDKIMALSHFTSSSEMLLLEKIRRELRTYGLTDKTLHHPAAIGIGGLKLHPIDPTLRYRTNNFYALYKLFEDLQARVLTTNSYMERDIALHKTQHYFESQKFEKCQRSARKFSKKYPKDRDLFDSYVVRCLYPAKNESYYSKLDDLLKRRPYSGSLVSHRNFFRSIMNDTRSYDLVKKYYTPQEIVSAEETLAHEQEQQKEFIQQGNELDLYIKSKFPKATKSSE